MRLWRFECRKLWKNKAVCGLIFGCFLLNGILLYWNTKNYDADSRCFPDAVKEVYTELQRVPRIGTEIWLNYELENIDRTIAGLEGVVDADEAYERRNALNHVLENVQAVYGYEDYLEGIEEQADLISSSALFGGGDLFSRRNAKLIPEKYCGLHGLQMKVENPQGVLLATESRMTDLILVILIILLAYFFFCMEREEGTMAFVRHTRYGGRRLGCTKAAVIFTGSLSAALILYGINFAIAWAVYGFGDIGRWIQSVEGYTACPWKIPLWEYFLLFLLAKLAASAVTAGVVIWIAVCGKNLMRTSIALLGITAVEYGFYAMIPPHSWLDILKQCNLFYFMGTEGFFKSYETVNVFCYPVSSVLVCAVAGAVVLAFTVFKISASYERVSQGEYAQKNAGKQLRAGEKRLKGHSLLYYEAYKILWVSGAGILMVVFLVFQFAVCSGEKTYFTLDELYYKNYIQKLEGEVTKEKLDFIREEDRRIAGIEQDLCSLEENGEGMSGEEKQEKRLMLDRQLLCQSAFHQVKEQAQRIGAKGIFLNEVGYGRLLDAGWQVRLAGELMFILILSFHSAFIVEKTARMPSVWNTMPGGKKKIQKRKWLLIATGTAVLCISADAMFCLYCMMHQGIVCLNCPIRYLPGFESWRHITVGGYLAGLCGLKILGGMIACKGIEKISQRTQNATTVLLTAESIAAVCYLLLKYILSWSGKISS